MLRFMSVKMQEKTRPTGAKGSAHLLRINRNTRCDDAARLVQSCVCCCKLSQLLRDSAVATPIDGPSYIVPGISGGSWICRIILIGAHGSDKAARVLGCAHEILKQRMWCERFGFQLRVKLNADKPGMIGPFHDLGQSTVG